MKKRFRSKAKTYRRKKRSFKRRVKRAFRKSSNRKIYMAPKFPFPDRLYAKVRNERTFNVIHNDNTAPFIFEISASNAYRPWTANTDTATGYSQLAGLYKYCTVIASRIDVFIIDSAATTAGHTYQVTVNPERDGDTHLTKAQLLQIHEIKRPSSVIVETSSSSPDTRKYIKKFQTPMTMYGVSKGAVKDDTDLYGHAVGSATDPQKAWRWAIYVICPWLGDTSVVQADFKVMVTHYCQFKELLQEPS